MDLRTGELTDGALAEFGAALKREAREREKANAEAKKWTASERAYQDRRYQAQREAWVAFHEDQIERHRRTLSILINHHREKLLALGAEEAG